MATPPDPELQHRIDRYLSDPVRPAFHAGRTYEDEPAALRDQLTDCFTHNGGPGPIDGSTPTHGDLRGIISPHIDFARGGTAYAWAYRELVRRTDADLFVVFGTSHEPMSELFSVSRKDFQTPLGIVPTDREFIDRMASHWASSVAGRLIDPLGNEMAHWTEHSIEFQAVFLQHLLAEKRPLRIVPILVASLSEFYTGGKLPDESLEVQAFLAGLRHAASGHSGNVCYIAGADLGHIGREFGDPWPVDDRRLAQQTADDRTLLELACDGDSSGVFRHVADQADRRRICGLAPIYMMLQAMGPTRGKLLDYGQAVAPDGSACVSFAGVAYSAPPKRPCRGNLH